MVIVPRSRAAVALLVLAVTMLAAHLLGLTGALSVAAVRSEVQQAGALAPLVFGGLLIVATLLQIPGIPLVLLAPALFPTSTAVAVTLPASHLAVVLNFELVRRLGGTPLKRVSHPLLVRVLGQLRERPVRTVALLRAITIMFPPVTSALALTSVRRRDHLVGTAFGMTPPLLVLLFVAAWFVRL